MGFLPSLLVAACVTAVVAIVVGAPALRRPGLYLAVTTFAFAVMTSSWLLWRDVFLDGETQVRLPRQVVPLPASLFEEGWPLQAQGSYYSLCLAALGVVLIGVALLQRSRLGRSMIAVRDNERAAASLGISPAAVKLTAFGIGGWIAGLAGGLFVGLLTRAAPGDFLAAESLRVISIVVVGGLSSVTGAVLGAFFVVGLPELFDDSVRGRPPHERGRDAHPAALLPGRPGAGPVQHPRPGLRVPRRAAGCSCRGPPSSRHPRSRPG